MVGSGPPFHALPSSLQDSINLVSVKIVESDSVFGTIFARDAIDYKCVYLFRSARDSSQVITSPVRSVYVLPF